MRKVLASVLALAAVVAPVAAALAAPRRAPARLVPLAQLDRASGLRTASEHRAESARLRAAVRRGARAPSHHPHPRHRRASHARRHRSARAIHVPRVLQAVAACESGGDPKSVGGGGTYRGKYQFDHETWASVGGSGDPAAAPEAEQDRRAAMLYARVGRSAWPVCGR